MRSLRPTLCVALFAASLAALPRLAHAQDALQGAWTIVEVSGTNADGAWTLESPQPSLYLFMGRHYSVMFVAGGEARPLMSEEANRNTISDEQMRSIFMPFIANSGTYEVEGSTLTTRPMVALWPNFMSGGSATYEFSVEGDWLTLKTGPEGQQTVSRLRRLE